MRLPNFELIPSEINTWVINELTKLCNGDVQIVL